WVSSARAMASVRNQWSAMSTLTRSVGRLSSLNEYASLCIPNDGRAGSMIRVIIAPPPPLVRAGLQAALGAHADLQIVPGPDSTDRPDELDLARADVVVADCDSGVHRASSTRSSGCRVLILA